MKKNFITHYLRIALGIVIFSIGLVFLTYDGDGIDKWWQIVSYFLWTIYFLGGGLWLLDVNY